MLTQAWKQWVAENKRLGVLDDDIIAVLKQNGMDDSLARLEVCGPPERSVQKEPNENVRDEATLHKRMLERRYHFSLIERELAALRPQLTIERKSGLSRAEFLRDYYSTNRPVILCDLMHDWKAMTRWTPAYFKKMCGEAMVEVSLRRDTNPNYELQPQKHHRTIRFSEYVDMVERGGESNDYYLTARNEFFKNPGVEPLLKDMEIFPEYLDGRHNWMFLWYGPKGTFTPLHHDEMNIFMAQVQGRKHIKLIPATQTDLLYNYESVYSPIHLEKPDYERYPKFRQATVLELELIPGEVLFLPVGWWHSVRSLDTSITVTFMNFVFPNRFDWGDPKTDAHTAYSQTNISSQENTSSQGDENDGRLQAMDESWQGWVRENLQRGCDRKEIAGILYKNLFSVRVIREAMGAEYPADMVFVYEPADSSVNIDYAALYSKPEMQLAKHKGFERIVTPKLQLYLLHDFLDDEECQSLIRVMDDSWRPSTITNYIEGFRTSTTCDLSHIKDPIINHIDEKIAAAIGIRPAYSEGTQGQHYMVGQEFKPHIDFFPHKSEAYQKYADTRGNRTWTFMIYLNDVAKGGATRFEHIDKTISPKRGMAVVWNNLQASGQPNSNTLHCGMPVEQGKKVIVTKWFREKGYGPMFYEDT